MVKKTNEPVGFSVLLFSHMVCYIKHKLWRELRVGAAD